MEGGSAPFLLPIAEQPLCGLDVAGESVADVCGGPAGARGGKVTRKATLALANGEVFEGLAVGAEGETAGEVVFNTAHTGYQEILTDPSYAGQLVTFTVSAVGNYGIHLGDEQAVPLEARRGRRRSAPAHPGRAGGRLLREAGNPAPAGGLGMRRRRRSGPHAGGGDPGPRAGRRGAEGRSGGPRGRQGRRCAG